MGPPTRRSPRSCSSAPPPSPTTSGRSSPSSASAPAASSPARSPSSRTRRERSHRKAEPSQRDQGRVGTPPSDGTLRVLLARLGGSFCLADNQHAGDQVLGHAGQPG